LTDENIKIETVKIESVEDSFENAGDLSKKLNLIGGSSEVRVEIAGGHKNTENVSNAEESEEFLIFPMGDEEIKIEEQVFEESESRKEAISGLSKRNFVNYSGVYPVRRPKTGLSDNKCANYKYKCYAEGCHRDFKLLVNRTEHIQMAHPEMNNHESSLVNRHIEIPCENCELSFKSSEALKKHKTDTGKSFKCQKCCLQFSTLCYLRGHMNSGCLDREGVKKELQKPKVRKKSYYKSKEDKIFFCSTEAKDEVNISSQYPEDGFVREKTPEKPEGATIEEIEDFNCHLCPKVFKSQNSLKFHIYNHKHRPFTCHLCPTTKIVMLRSQKELDYHIERKHTKIKCDYPDCDYINIKTKMREHVNSKHLKIRKFKCDHCDYNGTTGAHLRRHMSVHTNEKRFKCQWCDYRSNQRPNTTNHEKLYCKYRKNDT